MSHSAYPTASDLERFIAASNLVTGLIPATTTTQAVTAGSNVSVPVGSSSGLAVGDVVLMDSGAAAELVTISAIADSTHFTATTLANNHASGVAVVQTLLGQVPYAGFDWATAVGDGIAAFESATGRQDLGKRMLATSMTRYYDAPSAYNTPLNLRADLAAFTSMTVASAAYALNTDFYLRPENADLDAKPWTWVEFDNPYAIGLRTPRRSIVIVGSWGRGTTIPDDAWDAMLMLAAIRVMPTVIALRSHGMQSIKVADNTYTFGVKGIYGPLRDIWEDMISRAVKAYYRSEDWF